MDLKTHVTPTGWTVVALKGRLDAHTAPVAGPALERAAGRSTRVALDLAGLEYLSSAGLRILLGLLKDGEARGGRVVLLRPGPTVHEVLEISGFTELLQVLPSEGALPA